jgi:hypothetical protein
MNATLAAGMIIDNYLGEDAQYYIGNEIKNDDMISILISNYEATVINQQPAEKAIFDPISDQIRKQLLPYLREFFQTRGKNESSDSVLVQ